MTLISNQLYAKEQIQLFLQATSRPYVTRCAENRLKALFKEITTELSSCTSPRTLVCCFLVYPFPLENNEASLISQKIKQCAGELVATRQSQPQSTPLLFGLWAKVQQLGSCTKLVNDLEGILSSKINGQTVLKLLVDGVTLNARLSARDWINTTIPGVNLNLDPFSDSPILHIFTWPQPTSVVKVCPELIFSEYEVFKKILKSKVRFDQVSRLELDFKDALKPEEIVCMHKIFPSLKVVTVYPTTIPNMAKVAAKFSLDLLILKNCGSYTDLHLENLKRTTVLFVGETVPRHTDFVMMFGDTQLIFVPENSHSSVPAVYTVDGVSDREIVALVTHASHMTGLYLTDCSITDTALQAIAACSQLRSISLSDCEGISDAGVQMLVGGCSQLETIDLSGCSQITDDTALEVVRRCANISSLSVADCPELSDVSIIILLYHNKNLKTLNVSNCPKMTDYIISFILENNKELDELIVDDSQFSPELVRELEKKNSQMIVRYTRTSSK